MKYTQDQMEASVSAWRNSGLSKKAFCRDQDIPYQTFHYWCKRLAVNQSAGFTEVSIDGDQYGGPCELVFPSGVRMMFKSQPSAGWLRELVG